MNEVFTAIVLGVVEGATEFLPVSSTGHLILFNEWFGFGEAFTKLFDIVIQSGAIFAVIVIFWKDLWPKSWSLKSLEEQWGKILAAFAVTAVLGVLFGDFIQEHLFSPWVVAITLIAYGLFFYIVEKRKLHSNDHPELVSGSVSYTHAALIGLAQALAMVPGTSRSGATIIALLLLGYSRVFAVRFSFLLAVPTLLAASAYSLLKYDNGISTSEFWLLATGFVVSFIVAYAVSKWFLRFIRNKTFIPFAYYRVILGVLVLAYFFIKMM
ncbi:MAG: undecaprenyl-diphosphate phosphatase [Patescibacteria group bacterium]|nr:undecaprenyl-diphosphate phosphatase [Patescibacteria group bacterium]